MMAGAMTAAATVKGADWPFRCLLVDCLLVDEPPPENLHPDSPAPGGAEVVGASGFRAAPLGGGTSVGNAPA